MTTVTVFLKIVSIESKRNGNENFLRIVYKCEQVSIESKRNGSEKYSLIASRYIHVSIHCKLNVDNRP